MKKKGYGLVPDPNEVTKTEFIGQQPGINKQKKKTLTRRKWGRPKVHSVQKKTKLKKKSLTRRKMREV